MPADSKIFNKLIHERWEIICVKLAQINFQVLTDKQWMTEEHFEDYI